MLIDFNKNKLVPVIVQDYKDLKVLMMAYTNEEAFNKTQKTGYAHYWSRSRQKLWKKGEESGNFQIIKKIYIDCDNDTILFMVDQIGNAACHTGYRSCFYRELENKELKITGVKIFDPAEKYKK